MLISPEMSPRVGRGRRGLAQAVVAHLASRACPARPSSRPWTNGASHQSRGSRGLCSQPHPSVPLSLLGVWCDLSHSARAPLPQRGKRTKRRLFPPRPPLWSLDDACDMEDENLTLESHPGARRPLPARALGTRHCGSEAGRAHLSACRRRGVAGLFPHDLLCDPGHAT